MAAITLVAARGPPESAGAPEITGRIVVAHGPTGDDTAAIQSAIDTVARTG